MRRIALPFAALFVLFTACRSSVTIPDLGEIYNKTARYHDAERNPIIVIPGILGTKLTDPSSQRVVWGAFGGGAVNPQRADDALLIALPMRTGVPFADLRDAVEPDGVLETIRIRLAGLPLKLRAYYQILLTLGVLGGYRDETYNPGGLDYGSDHFTCFQFDYDWRRDNVENARRLHAFIEEKRAYVAAETERRFGVKDPEIRFDIVAHSMGGLITRYYLRYGDQELPADGSLPELDWAGARYVDRAVLVAPPNAGALDALGNLVDGRKFGPMTPRYNAALLGTFPSLYQMLPRTRHGAVVDAAGQKVDILDPAVWEERGWGLAAPDQAAVVANLLREVNDPGEARRIARDHLRKSLERARRFHAALDLPASPPASTGIFLIAGDAVDTARVATAGDNGRLEVTRFGPGDGSVLRSSALLDEREGQEWGPRLESPIAWQDVDFLFSNHLGMTKDPVFSDNILYLLLEAPR